MRSTQVKFCGTVYCAEQVSVVLIFECEDCHYAKKGYTFLIEGVIHQLAR